MPIANSWHHFIYASRGWHTYSSDVLFCDGISRKLGM
uniref:Uncharacterized protein n=1 Tax=Arundo donax TaxID=35708 RepID=A0A0A9A8I7_ARUDO